MPSAYFIGGNDPLTLSMFLAPLLEGLQARAGGFCPSQKMCCSAPSIYKLLLTNQARSYSRNVFSFRDGIFLCPRLTQNFHSPASVP